MKQTQTTRCVVRSRGWHGAYAAISVWIVALMGTLTSSVTAQDERPRYGYGAPLPFARTDLSARQPRRLPAPQRVQQSAPRRVVKTKPATKKVSYTPAPRRLAPKAPSKKTVSRPVVKSSKKTSPGVNSFLKDCRAAAKKGYRYVFGSANPATGGLDCSGTVLSLLRKQGVKGVPRTSIEQYRWLKRKNTFTRVYPWGSSGDYLNKLKPGDLLFWTDTFKSDRQPNVTHVMIYMGKDAKTGKRMMFGARGKKGKGVNGHNVDLFEFKYPKKRNVGKFFGFGSVPGL